MSKQLWVLTVAISIIALITGDHSSSGCKKIGDICCDFSKDQNIKAMFQNKLFGINYLCCIYSYEHVYFGCQKNLNFDVKHRIFLFISFKFLEIPLK